MVLIFVAIVAAFSVWLATRPTARAWIRWAPREGWSWSLPVKDD